jgi:hypothetical protein
MWQLILRGVAVGVLRRVFVVIAAPFVVLIVSPVIFLRASILAGRSQQKFKFAVLDGYDSVWEFIVTAFIFPLYSDIDRTEAARRKASNESLQPTAGAALKG